MSAATAPPAIPKALLPILGVVAVLGMVIAASTNVEALLKFGHAIYGSNLDWTLPAAVIGYEIVSSIVYFMTPKELPGVRKSAAVGAIVGFAATVLLAVLWAFIESGELPGGLWLKIVMKPVPSFIAAAFLHMLVLVWHARTAAPVTEEKAVPVAETVPAPVLPPPAPIRKPVINTPHARKPEAVAPPTAAPKPVAAPATPPAAKPAPTPAAEEALPRVARQHVDRAVEVLKEIVAKDGDPAALESGQAMKYFKGCSDRTVRAALQVARFEMGIPPKKQRHLISA